MFHVAEWALPSPLHFCIMKCYQKVPQKLPARQVKYCTSLHSSKIKLIVREKSICFKEIIKLFKTSADLTGEHPFSCNSNISFNNWSSSTMKKDKLYSGSLFSIGLIWMWFLSCGTYPLTEWCKCRQNATQEDTPGTGLPPGRSLNLCLHSPCPADFCREHLHLSKGKRWGLKTGNERV